MQFHRIEITNGCDGNPRPKTTRPCRPSGHRRGHETAKVRVSEGRSTFMEVCVGYSQRIRQTTTSLYGRSMVTSVWKQVESQGIANSVKRGDVNPRLFENLVSQGKLPRSLDCSELAICPRE